MVEANGQISVVVPSLRHLLADRVACVDSVSLRVASAAAVQNSRDCRPRRIGLGFFRNFAAGAIGENYRVALAILS